MMARRSAAFPTELELQILKVLWGRDPLPVRDVRQGLAEMGRDLAHTSVITTLNVMVQKKYLKRRMRRNACLFSPRVTREDVSRTMLGDVIERVFDGSTKAVMLSLFDCAEVNAETIQELRQLVNQKAKEVSQ
jgi:predicted transcriptional regulator